ncbi:MAG TPA: glutamate-5-semialdehyde dehydrogenase [Candidatus Manganitrophaceae bacterium]|nr:glutamate-5-semialdehyde dehydrogenase [Candidatus Manganitrophaceae bacterium]
MALKEELKEQTAKTKEAARILAKRSSDLKNRALLAMAARLESEKSFLLAENAKDLAAGREKGLAAPLLERLTLNPKRIGEMAAGLREVAALPDPVGEVMKMIRRPNGIQVGQMRVPIGVIGIIYESRPNVTADAAALCIKSGNGVVLRGGSEAIHSNIAIARLLQEAGEAEGLPPHAITLIETTDRQAIYELLQLEASIDLIIPRGGEGLIRMVVENSKIPVMKHDKGICHTFVDASADLRMAEEICLNAKVQRPATCNAMETLLIHQEIAPAFLPKIAKRLREAGVELRGCPKTQAILRKLAEPEISAASEADWKTEYLDLILSIKVVESLEEGMAHIASYGSQHSEAIITQDYTHAMRFLNEVDASAVFVNASTRLNDGYQLGLGAEMGISTSRIHARGPMGLEALTCTKFIVFGDGQIRS